MNSKGMMRLKNNVWQVITFCLLLFVVLFAEDGFLEPLSNKIPSEHTLTTNPPPSPETILPLPSEENKTENEAENQQNQTEEPTESEEETERIESPSSADSNTTSQNQAEEIPSTEPTNTVIVESNIIDVVIPDTEEPSIIIPTTPQPSQPQIPITPQPQEIIPDPTPAPMPEPEPNEPTVIEPEKTQSAEEKPFWQSESSRQLNNLISVATAGQASFQKNSQRRGWYSNGGRLYDYYQERFITTADFVAEGFLEKGLDSSQYILLLILGTDLELFFNDFQIPQEYKGLTLFAVQKIDGEYVVVAPSGKICSLTENNFNRLLNLYNPIHGPVVQLSSASEEYGRILNFICLFEGRFEDYFVREIRKDDKYAVVIFSTTDNTADIKQYILKNENNFWEVVFPDTQYQAYPITSINRYLPDFNLKLLPSYHLGSWQGSIFREQGGAIAALYSLRVIENTDEIFYQCATNSCAYVVLNTGEAYICFIQDGIWKAEPVASDYDAKKRLLEVTGRDYGFLVLDN